MMIYRYTVVGTQNKYMIQCWQFIDIICLPIVLNSYNIFVDLIRLILIVECYIQNTLIIEVLRVWCSQAHRIQTRWINKYN